MTVLEGVGLFAGAGGAVASAVIAAIALRENRKRREAEDRLRALQIARTEREALSLTQADVSAEWRSYPGNRHPEIVLTNNGAGEARDIRINAHELEEYCLDWERLPLASLRPGRHERLRVMGVANWGPPLDVEVSWRDDGGEHTEQFHLMQ